MLRLSDQAYLSRERIPMRRKGGSHVAVSFVFVKIRKRISGQARVCGPFPAQSDTSDASDGRW